jgi:hypothetical protein
MVRRTGPSDSLILVVIFCTASLAMATAQTPEPADVRVLLHVAHVVQGLFGGMITQGFGGANEDAVVQIARKGARLVTARPTKRYVEIVDLEERKVYQVDLRDRVYTPSTFEQLRGDVSRRYRDAMEMARLAPIVFSEGLIDLPNQSRRRADRFKYVVSSAPTGKTKMVAGHDAREVVIELTAFDERKTMEQDGGWIVRAEVWVGPRLAEIEALKAARREYLAAVTRDVCLCPFRDLDIRDNASLDGSFAEIGPVASRTLAEVDRLDGTVLTGTISFQMAWSAGDRKWRGAAEPVSVLIMGLEYQAIGYTVNDADVNIPPGFALKKR